MKRLAAILTIVTALLTSLPSYAQRTQLMQEDISYVNVLKYGLALNATTINAAVTAIGSTNQRTLFLTTGAWSLTSNVTITPNITLLVPVGAIVSINSGITLTINGPLQADNPLWYTGAGTLVVNYRDSSVDSMSSFIVSGCTPAVPAASLTLATFACRGNIVANSLWTHANQTTSAVGPLSGGNGTYWIALHRDTTTAVTSWTRQTDTRYLWQLSATQPAQPTGATIFAQVTVAAGAITAVADTATHYVTGTEVLAANRTTGPLSHWLFTPGSCLNISTGITWTHLGRITAPLQKIFCGVGTVLFTSGVKSSLTAYPQWWGGDPTGVVDSASAINAAITSEPNMVNMQGVWGISSPIFINKDGTILDGVSRVRSHIVPLVANLSTGGSANAIMIVTTNAFNGTIRSLRFLSSGVVFTGWCISAVEGGPVGEQAMISGNVHDVWASTGTLAAGFFTGGAIDSWFHDLQFESILVRFQSVGGISNTAFSNIDDLLTYDPFIDASGATGAVASIIISDINVSQHHRGYYFKLKDALDVKISNINYTFQDDGVAISAGLLSDESSTRVSLTNFSTKREVGATGVWNAFLLKNSYAQISHGSILNLANGTPLTIQGTTYNEISINDVTVRGALTSQISVAASVVGILKITNSIFEVSTGYIANFTGALNITLVNNRFLNANYNVAASVPMFTNDGSGIIEFTDNTIGDNDALSHSTYVFTMTGTGQWRLKGNTIIGMLAAELVGVGSTQQPMLLGGNTYIDTGTNLTEWIRNAVVTPAAAVTPMFRGELYLNTATGIWYKAAGFTNADWKALN